MTVLESEADLGGGSGEDSHTCPGCNIVMDRTEPVYRNIWSCEGDTYKCGVEVHEFVRQ